MVLICMRFANNFSCFHEVLDAFLMLHQAFVRQPIEASPTPPYIADNPKFTPYFDGCIGALDGTHIAMHIPSADQPRYRNRKGYISQNVLAVCDFDMMFIYILAGWEGSAHDSRVLMDARLNRGLNPPLGRYYLGDAGYSNSEYVMVPYRGVRYHLKEQRLAAQRPQNAKELFNLRHASLRNVIERIFGVFKRRFRIFDKAPEYSSDIQVKLILALAGLHNYIREAEGATEDDLESYLDENMEESENPIRPIQDGGSAAMNRLRDQIAEDMWKDYQAILLAI
jgi:hypothetical protein